MAILGLLIVLAVAFAALWLLRLLWRVVMRDIANSPTHTEMTADEEGYAHSGLYGYSPNTAYPQTQYGSLFNPDAEWAERTGYDRDHHDGDEHEQ